MHLYHVGLGDHETSQMFFIHNVPRSRVCTHTHMHTLQIFVLSFHALFEPLLQVLHSLLLPDHVLYLLGSRKLVTVLIGRNVFEGKGCVLFPYIPRPSPASAIELMSIYYCWMKLSIFQRTQQALQYLLYKTNKATPLTSSHGPSQNLFSPSLRLLLGGEEQRALMSVPVFEFRILQPPAGSPCNISNKKLCVLKGAGLPPAPALCVLLPRSHA